MIRTRDWEHKAACSRIGEFSKLSGLTVKTLRFYHEEGLLVPAFVDPDTGYRYYDEQADRDRSRHRLSPQPRIFDQRHQSSCSARRTRPAYSICSSDNGRRSKSRSSICKRRFGHWINSSPKKGKVWRWQRFPKTSAKRTWTRCWLRESE